MKTSATTDEARVRTRVRQHVLAPRRPSICHAASLILVAFVVAHARAEKDAANETAPADQPQGLIPVPDYGGDLWHRSHLAGDLGGARTDLANHGVQFELQFQQYFQAVVDGGIDTDGEYGGKGSYKLKLDLMRMGVMPGALIYVRGESRYGKGVLGKTGQLLPSNTTALVPLDYTDIQQDADIALTNLSYMQFLSEQFGLVVGKLDMFDADPNEFASGRGDTQFMNYNLIFAAPTAIAPACTMGAGIILLPNKYWTITSIVLSATDSTFSNGFDDLDEGGIWATAIMHQYRLGDLPGGANANFLYFFDKDFVDLDSFALVPGDGLISSSEDESWLVALSFWQYLFTEESSEGPLDVTNERPDLQGWGLFGRLGIADGDTNPFQTNVSIGVGSRGAIPSRDNDVLGIGYFYTDTDSSTIDIEGARTRIGGRLRQRLGGRLDLEDHVQGFEAFYSLAITPAAKLTFDLQVLESAVSHLDTAIVLGVRFDMRF